MYYFEDSQRQKSVSIILTMAVVAVLSVRAVPANGQSTPPKLEFRGAWIATVINLDWPLSNSSSTATQKTQLVGLMDDLAETGVNAVFFQIRSESDAFYASSIEPWSRHLTGAQGVPPDPFYDPLEFAIQLAHDRGMELHAWFNPFRVRRNITDGTQLDPLHVSRTHPEWTLTINTIQILNPGIPEAREYVIDVIKDVIRRYDVDGVHFDDYFYPYPPNEIESADAATYATYGGGFNTITAWRTDNINQFIRDVSEQIAIVNPNLKFGVSPFGIWRSGVPDEIIGLSSVDVLFADPTKWMAEGWVDYIAPQLYWPFGGPQDFDALATWWVSVSNGRHIYPGIAAYKVDPLTWGGTPYGLSEIPNQIRFSRQTAGIEGTVLFRAENLTPGRAQGLSDSLSGNLYRTKAITPPFLWRDDIFFPPPGAPESLGLIETTGKREGSMTLVWDPSFLGTPARKFGVYRVRSSVEPDPRAMTNDPANLLAITFKPSYSDNPEISVEPYYYTVTAISANSIEGDESNVVRYNATGLAAEIADVASFGFKSVSPNPVSTGAEIVFEMQNTGTVSLALFDALGRKIAVLIDAEYRVQGTHSMHVDVTGFAGRSLASGVYFLVLEVDTGRVSRPIVVAR